MPKAEVEGSPVMTGRDGSVDYAAKMDLLDPSLVAHSERHVYRVVEVVGTSAKSVDGAIKSAIARAHQTIRHLRWFEVARTSGHVDDGRSATFRSR